MRADLSLQQAPPFSVPARFLISAPFFSMIAALLLLWHGPGMISHRWTPELLAVTHILTVGFLAMSMLGAMMQLMPVLLGKTFPRPVLFSTIIHSSLFLGCAILATAWLMSIPVLFIASMMLLGTSFTLFIVVTTILLHRSKSTHVTRIMMISALMALFVTVCIGLYLTLGHAGLIPLARYMTDLHLSFGLFGWIPLLIIAIAYHVIPMFQITDEYPALHQRYMGWCILLALSTLTLSFVFSMEMLKQLSFILLASCLLIFSLTTLWVLYKRRRQLPDLTLNFWRLAMICLVLAVSIWTITALLNLVVPGLILGLLMIHGFAMTSVNGMMYKIIPFLIWLHLSTKNKNLRDNEKRDLQVKVPHMRNIIPEAAGYWQFRFHLVSVILLILATIWPIWFYYPATSMFALAQIFLLFNLAMAAHFYNNKLAELSEES